MIKTEIQISILSETSSSPNSNSSFIVAGRKALETGQSQNMGEGRGRQGRLALVIIIGMIMMMSLMIPFVIIIAFIVIVIVLTSTRDGRGGTPLLDTKLMLQVRNLPSVHPRSIC